MSAIPAFKLVEAGFSQPQVEALAEFMQTEAARRSDLLEAKAELKADIIASEHRLDARIGEAIASEHRLDARIGEAKADTLKAVMALLLTAVAINSVVVLGAMFGLAKLLGH